MPYYVHTTDNKPAWREGLRWSLIRPYDRANVPPFENSDPSVCLSFPDAKTANLRLQALVKQAKTEKSGIKWAPVVFIPTYTQAEEWRQRELHRLSGELPPEFDKDGKRIYYVSIPWKDDDWYCCDPRENDDHATPWASMHYGHMSRVLPGQVAFTPTEEYGVQNRKTRMTVARYLDKFARLYNGHPALTAKQIAHYVAIVKAHADQQLKIARTGADIVKVYLNGPASCMSHSVGDYETGGVHPVMAYGDSDLGVAYLGDPATGVSARSIVWPDKQTYIRIYGDQTLQHVLEDNGYTHDSLAGATFPAIRLANDEYLFPYIDTHRRDDGMTADLITKADGKQYFKLKPSGGEYDAKVTEGVARPVEDEENYTCSNCGEQISGTEYDGNSGLCNSCHEDHWSCARCSADSYNTDDQYSSEDGDCYCEDCYHKLFARCTECDKEYDKTENRVSKRARHVADYCNDCSDGRMICETCQEMVDDDDTETVCADCRHNAEEDTEEETDKETEIV